MLRATWKGTISFGLISIPIILFNSLLPSRHPSFRQINKKTGTPIKYKRVDAKTEKEVAWKDVGKGYQYDNEHILPVAEDELKRVAGDNTHLIAINEFVDKNNIHFINVQATYYLAPDKKGDKGYVLLREALKQTHTIGIAKIILSAKEYLAAVSIYENALVMHLLHYNDAMRDLGELNIPQEALKKYKVTHTEVEIAKKLINSMTAQWKPEKFKDNYQDAVHKWVENKLNHLPKSKIAPKSIAKKSTAVLNFLELLKKSLISEKRRKSKIKKRILSKVVAAKRHSTRH